MSEQPNNTKPTSAYDSPAWVRLSPYAQQQVDAFAREQGITLHHATDKATLERLIAQYHRTSW